MKPPPYKKKLRPAEKPMTEIKTTILETMRGMKKENINSRFGINIFIPAPICVSVFSSFRISWLSEQVLFNLYPNCTNCSKKGENIKAFFNN